MNRKVPTWVWKLIEEVQAGAAYARPHDVITYSQQPEVRARYEQADRDEQEQIVRRQVLAALALKQGLRRKAQMDDLDRIEAQERADVLADLHWPWEQTGTDE